VVPTRRIEARKMGCIGLPLALRRSALGCLKLEKPMPRAVSMLQAGLISGFSIVLVWFGHPGCIFTWARLSSLWQPEGYILSWLESTSRNVPYIEVRTSALLGYTSCYLEAFASRRGAECFPLVDHTDPHVRPTTIYHIAHRTRAHMWPYTLKTASELMFQTFDVIS
jgi:hypothetical protein